MWLKRVWASTHVWLVWTVFRVLTQCKNINDTELRPTIAFAIWVLKDTANYALVLYVLFVINQTTTMAQMWSKKPGGGSAAAPEGKSSQVQEQADNGRPSSPGRKLEFFYSISIDMAFESKYSGVSCNKRCCLAFVNKCLHLYISVKWDNNHILQGSIII